MAIRDLVSLLAAGEWQRRGACVGEDPELFFPALGNDSEANKITNEREAEAKAICARCPVRRDCARDFWLEPCGTFGGFSASERIEFRRRRITPMRAIDLDEQEDPKAKEVHRSASVGHPPRAYTSAERKKAIEMYERGYGCRRIAKALTRPGKPQPGPKSVRTMLLRAGVKLREPGKVPSGIPYGSSLGRQIGFFLEAGVPPNQIADFSGCHVDTVHLHRRRLSK